MNTLSTMYRPDNHKIFKCYTLILAILLFFLPPMAKAQQSKQAENYRINLNNWLTSNGDIKSVELTGAWHFVPNKLINPKEVGSHNPLKAYVPDKWRTSQYSELFPNSKGEASYWINITPPKNIKLDQTYALNFTMVCSAATTYFYPINSPEKPEIAHIGVIDGKANTTPFLGAKIIPVRFSSHEPHRLLIHTVNYDFWTGGLCGRIYFDTYEHAQQSMTAKVVHISILLSMLAMAGFYLLSFYTHNPSNKHTMLLGFCCLTMSVVFFHLYNYVELLSSNIQNWHYEFKIRNMYISVAWLGTMLALFYNSFMQFSRNKIFVYSLIGVAIFLSGLMIITPRDYLWISVSTVAIFMISTGILCLIILWRSIKLKKPYAKIIFTTALLTLLIGPTEIYFVNPLGEIPYFTFYIILILLFVTSQIVSKNYSATFAMANRLSKNLQAEVDKQTIKLTQQNESLEKAQSDLTRANEALRLLSITDGLTGLSNRMHFMDEYNKEWRRCARHEAHISLLMLDADHFKELNDTQGHLAGDAVLRKIAEIISLNTQRGREISARFGGEEFVIILPDTNLDIAYRSAEKIRQDIESAVILYNDKYLKTSVSIGVASIKANMSSDPQALLDTADKAMYHAKRNGRNQVAKANLTP